MAQANDSLLSTIRSTPKDAQVMAAILKEMGVDDYEPRVLNQMLEFTYRYVSNIIEDAQLYNNHAKKKPPIDIDDVNLAIHLQQERNTNAPDREITVEMAKLRNSMALPLIKSSAGLRLPPDRFSLTACNYRLKSSSKKGRTVHTVSRLNSPSNAVNKNSPVALLNKQAIMSRPSISKQVTTPIIKYSEESRVVTSAPTLSSVPLTVTTSITPATSGTHILMPSTEGMNTEMKLSSEISSVKRELENDDDYDMEM